MSPPPLDAIDHVHVHVRDRAAAEQWYRRTLGFERLPELAFWAVGGGPLTVANASGTVHLALFEGPAPAQACRSTIAMRASAPALLAWQADLRRVLGRDIALVDHAVSWSIYFADPDGNPFEITSYAYAEVAEAVARQPAA